MTPDQRAKRIAADVQRLLPMFRWLSNSVLTERLRFPTRLVDFALRREWEAVVRHRCVGDVSISQMDAESDIYCPHCNKTWTWHEVSKMTAETLEREFVTLNAPTYDTAEPDWPEKLDWVETDKSMHLALRPMTVKEILTARVEEMYNLRHQMAKENS